MPDLDSTQIGSGDEAPIFGGSGFGGSGSSLDSSSFDWGSLVSKGAPLALSLLAPKASNSNAGEISQIEKNATSLNTSGSKLVSTGEQALAPALKYFQALVSGDPSALAAATAPDRGRIIDQYDAARKSISQFSPRGGGQASSTNQGLTKEASDLATLPAVARNNAASTLATLGKSNIDTGLTAEQQSTQALSQVLGPIFQNQQADNQSIGQTFAAIGKFIGPLILAAAA